MDIAVLVDFMSPIIVVVCLCVGFIVKQFIPGETVNKFIPLIVGILGIVLNIWACGVIDIDVVAIGLVSGLASTGLYELFSNFLGNLSSPTKKGE